jgi:hypothetical protein
MRIFGKYISELYKREIMENFFKTNIENILEENNVRLNPRRKAELELINRKLERELDREYDPYEWKLIKLPNGKMKSVIVKENDIYKNW